MLLSLTACGSSTSDEPSSQAGGGAQGGGDAGAAGDNATGGSSGAHAQLTDFAVWPMPNAPGLGLPNTESYDDTSTPGVVHDLVTGLDWLQNPGVTLYTRPDAVSYCEALSLGENDDWRLPTFIELVSLFNVVPSAGANPSYIAAVFQASGAYWSTSSVISNPELVRMVAFDADGCGPAKACSIGVLGDPSKAVGGAFCVRTSNASANGARFEVASDHVNDTGTGLSWLVLPAASQNGTAADALSRCTALGNGARVPSITELLTILTPVLDPTVFPGWPGNEFAWSSSTIPAIPDSFWIGGITGASEASASTSTNRVQCVR